MSGFNSIPPLPNGATANTADALGLNAAGQPMSMGMGMGMGDPFAFDEALLYVHVIFPKPRNYKSQTNFVITQ